MAHAHFYAGRFEEAVRWAEAARSDQPDDTTAARIVAASHAMDGNTPRGPASCGKAGADRPEPPSFQAPECLRAVSTGGAGSV
jgi:hypothetical protein